MKDLEFIEETHQYLYKGVIVPCVSDIIDYAFPNTYSAIPYEVLKNAADFGSSVHAIIEKLLTGKKVANKELKDEYIKHCIDEFKRLNESENIKVKAVEQTGTYKGLYAGTFDILTTDDIIYDIKTTSKLYIDNETLQEKLNLQISLYYLMLFDKVKPYGKAMWLPKRAKGKIAEVKCWTKKDLLKLIKEFRKAKGYEEV